MPKLTIHNDTPLGGPQRLMVRGPSGKRYVFEAGKPTKAHMKPKEG